MNNCLTAHLLVLSIMASSCVYYPIEESVGGIEDAGIGFEKDVECRQVEWQRVGETYSHYHLDFPYCMELRLDPNPVFVFRNLECYNELYSSAELPEAPDFDSQVVAFFCDPFGGCGWDVLIKSVKACDDHVEMKFEIVKPCYTCHGYAPKCVALIISEIDKPVLAVAQLREEYPCW